MIRLIFFLAAMFYLLPGALQAQQLPQISPRCVLKQMVGLTEINVHYNRPNVRGRKIWGHLVPYHKVWRTGANEATRISFSDDVWLNGNKIKAGEYALFSIPGPREWTILFNKNTQSWGTQDYREEDNVLAFKVKPLKIKHEETLTFSVNNITRNTADLWLSWEKVSVPISIRVEVDEKTSRNIDQAIASAEASQQTDNWQIYANCAEYCLRHNIRIEEAGVWIDKAIALSNHNFRAVWLKADWLALQQDFKGAIEMAKKSLKLGMAERGHKFAYKEELEKSIALWESKLN